MKGCVTRLNLAGSKRQRIYERNERALATGLRFMEPAAPGPTGVEGECDWFMGEII